MEVPKDVVKRIRQKAERDYPDDFLMQERTISSQIEAWQKIQGKYADKPDTE